MSGIELIVIVVLLMYIFWKKIIQTNVLEWRDLEWHDFENNPDDKPEEEGSYLCYITNVDHDENCMFYGILDFHNGHFVLNSSDGIFDSTDSWDDIVLGWAKIKKFERKPRRK
jgi:hypothetical protein